MHDQEGAHKFVKVTAGKCQTCGCSMELVHVEDMQDIDNSKH